MGGMNGGVGFCRKVVRAQRVLRQQEFGAGRLCFLEDPLGLVQHVVFDQARANGASLGLDKGVGHAAAHDQAVHPVHEVLEDGQLAAHFGAADDGQQRFGWGRKHLVECFDFAVHEEAKRLVLWEELGDDGRGGMRAVGGPEGVVDIDVAVLGQLPGKKLISRLFFWMEAQVFQQRDFPRFQLLRHVECRIAHAVRGERNVSAQQLGDASDEVLQRQPGIGALGPPKVAHQHHGSASIQQGLDGGNGPSNAGVVRDVMCTVEGDVEVHANQGTLALNLKVG